MTGLTPTPPGAGLASTDESLAAGYDAALYDLDGVLYLGTEPVPYAAEAVAAARQVGLRAGFVTNNASRRPQAVADLLGRVGVPAEAHDVVTSAHAALRLVAEHHPSGSVVLVIGSEDLVHEVEEAGYRAVRSADAAPPVAGSDARPAPPSTAADHGRPVAVLQGMSPDVGWAHLAEASIALHAGATWVAANTDSTFPTTRGPLPGCGALVAALVTATGRRPLVAGKPSPVLHAEAVERLGCRRPLVVGDRLDTDVLGAVAAGADSLLVLTGVCTRADLLAAPPGSRPAFVAPDLRGLLAPHPPVAIVGGVARCGAAEASYDGDALVSTGAGVEELRAVCALAWDRADAGDTARPR